MIEFGFANRLPVLRRLVGEESRAAGEPPSRYPSRRLTSARANGWTGPLPAARNTPDSPMQGIYKEFVPKKYDRETPQVVEIKADTTKLDFDLK